MNQSDGFCFLLNILREVKDQHGFIHTNSLYFAAGYIFIIHHSMKWIDTVYYVIFFSFQICFHSLCQLTNLFALNIEIFGKNKPLYNFTTFQTDFHSAWECEINVTCCPMFLFCAVIHVWLCQVPSASCRMDVLTVNSLHTGFFFEETHICTISWN